MPTTMQAALLKTRTHLYEKEIKCDTNLCTSQCNSMTSWKHIEAAPTKRQVLSNMAAIISIHCLVSVYLT